MPYTTTKKLRRLNHINRCALFPVLKTTSVAEHSWHVSVLVTCVFFELFQKGFDLQLGKLLTAAVFHDAEECFITDIPYPVKRRIKPALKLLLPELLEQELPNAPEWITNLINNQTDLTELEVRVVKACDMAELVMYAREEYHMGNNKILPLLVRAVQELTFLNNDLGSELLLHIVEEPNDYCFDENTI